jgi:hypothetical protein
MCREGQIRGGVRKGAPDLLTRFLSSFFTRAPFPLQRPGFLFRNTLRGALPTPPGALPPQRKSNPARERKGKAKVEGTLLPRNIYNLIHNSMLTCLSVD